MVYIVNMTMEYNGSITARLRHIMQSRGLTQRRTAELLRLDPSNLSKVLSGKLPFSEGLVNRIVIDMGVSKQWLVTGEGTPYEKTPATREVLVPDQIVPRCSEAGIPVYDLDVTAGCRPLSALFGETLPVGRVILPEIPEGCALVKVRGDSMSPRIVNGGYVAIRDIPCGRNIFWGQIYVVELDAMRMVKFVRRHPDPAKVILHSDNPAYDDMDVVRADIRSLYMVEAILNYEVQ